MRVIIQLHQYVKFAFSDDDTRKRGSMAALVLLSLTSARRPVPLRRPVLIVADVGVDDAAALLWALGSPQLEILGIASSLGCHNDPLQTTNNARRLLVAANRSDVPVFVGARFPLGTSVPLEGDGSRFVQR